MAVSRPCAGVTKVWLDDGILVGRFEFFFSALCTPVVLLCFEHVPVIDEDVRRSLGTEKARRRK